MAGKKGKQQDDGPRTDASGRELYEWEVSPEESAPSFADDGEEAGRSEADQVGKPN